MSLPESRLRVLRDEPIHTAGRYVLYWMTAARRAQWNWALDRAVEHCRELGRPLVILEALRCGHAWASDRLHAFVLQGMADNRRQFADSDILHHAYVEPQAGAGKGLLAALAEEACLVVGDDYPTYFLPRMNAAAAAAIPRRFEAVDSNGVVPIRDADRLFTTAHSFRRHLQKVLPDLLQQKPHSRRPARGSLPRLDALPSSITKRWPAASDELLEATPEVLAELPIDHEVGVVDLCGGSSAARRRWHGFLEHRLPHYGSRRNRPEEEGTSGLSPALHFGMISSHQCVQELLDHQDWSASRLGKKTNGSREGWWGLQVSAEAFLDQILTWRELGHNGCVQREDHDQYRSLPEWARTTLAEHAADPRPQTYTLRQFEQAQTHDPLWNAAQRQLVREGMIHNYLRMLWGKKILHWSKTPQQALKTMISLNDKYALDGRDPNSYSGIFWVLGRYDRAWGPERPIFGKVRYMTSDNTARKFPVKGYLQMYAES